MDSKADYISMSTIKRISVALCIGTVERVLSVVMIFSLINHFPLKNKTTKNGHPSSWLIPKPLLFCFSLKINF